MCFQTSIISNYCISDGTEPRKFSALIASAMTTLTNHFYNNISFRVNNLIDYLYWTLALLSLNEIDLSLMMIGR